MLRHVAHTIDVVEDLLRTHPCERLLLAGPEEALALLRRELPQSLQARIAGTLQVELFASDTEVLNAALPVAEAAERQAELEKINALIEGPPTRALLDPDLTLEALEGGRADTLYIADSFVESGWECDKCHHLLLHGAICPRCGQQGAEIPSLKEGVLELALRQGAEVEIVSGVAAARLMEFGGLGARLRY